jgi:hypothetical protein
MADGGHPVRLAYATSQDGRTMVRVKVKDLAAERRVHVRGRSGSDWQDYELSPTSHHIGYDVFSGTVPHSEEFAVSYSADEDSYWDNNDLRNYRVPLWANAIGGKVSLRRASLGILGTARRWLQGEIYVDNISFGKSVGIHMLPDRASRWMDLTAAYDGVAGEGAGGPWVKGPVERWRFRSPVFDGNDCRFAAFYQDLDSADVYWDNNFGQDYRFGGDSTLG